VADLLECLIQIKALRETTNRLVRRLEAGWAPIAGGDRSSSTPMRSPNPADTRAFLAGLLTDEEAYLECLRNALPNGPALGRDGRALLTTSRIPATAGIQATPG
jgi:hypothetical protein